MNWRSILFSAGSIVIAVLVWVFSWGPLEHLGLGAFDPLTRICLVFLVLSLGEAALVRTIK